MVESLEELLSESDFVTLHLSLTEETRGLIDRTRLDGARDGIRIVNAARGELVDEDALAEALRSGKVAGAALDVFSEEPYTGPLLGARQRDRDPSPGRVDSGGAGPGRDHRRRAGRCGTRRPAGYERRQHARGRSRGHGAAGAVLAARGEAGCACCGAGGREPDAARLPVLRPAGRAGYAAPHRRCLERHLPGSGSISR